MGGRGANFQRTVSPPIQTQQLQPDPLNGTQPPTGVTQAALANMSDQELHDFLIDVNKTDIPTFLSDLHLQRMLYAMGMNGKPEVVDQNTFDGLAQNSPVLYRTVNDTVVDGVPFTSSDCCDMLIDGDLTFVGRGIHGDGLYFSNSLSGSKAYGDHTGSDRWCGAEQQSKSYFRDSAQAGLRRLCEVPSAGAQGAGLCEVAQLARQLQPIRPDTRLQCYLVRPV